jgi:hypothetical protein
MALISKSKLPRKQPHLTRTGKPRIFAYSVEKLIEMRDKSQRLRDKNKINNRIISLAAKHS